MVSRVLVSFVLAFGSHVTVTRSFIVPARRAARILAPRSAVGPDDEVAAVEGDWRSFRAKLMDGNFGLASTDDDVDDDGDGVAPSTDDDRVSEEAVAAAADATKAAAEARAAVAPRNQALLRKQDPVLAAEYLEGAWAHATGEPEVGGLLLRRPFEAELLSSKGYWRDVIFKAARKELLASPVLEPSDLGVPERIDEKFEAWTANQAYMFRLTERVVKREMAKIVKAVETSGGGGGGGGGGRGGKGGGGGGRDVTAAITPPQRQLLEKFSAYRSSWQEVLLVLSMSAEEGASAVVINRPLCQGLSPQLAALIHGGQDGLEQHLKAAATKGPSKAFDGFDDVKECE